MSAKTTFWYGLVMALAVVGSTVALPLSTNEDQETQNGKTVVLPEQPKTPLATESAQTTGQTEDLAAVSTDQSPVAQTAKAEPTDGGATATATDVTSESTSGVQQTENAVAGSTVPAESATGSDDQSSEPTTAPTAVAQSDSAKPSAAVAPGPAPEAVVGNGQRPKPYYAGDAQTLKVRPTMPFYLEFFQPFQPLSAQYAPDRQNQWPSRQQPFGAVVDPFDPFESNPVMPPFNQIIEAYTNEFRKMLESFDQNMQRVPQPAEIFDKTESGSNKPVGKTTSKTEIINGHVVQINETTYTNGDENHKSFYHFKEIQVLPEANNKNIANEKVTSMTKDDSEKIELNEIKRDQVELFDDVAKPAIQPNLVKKVE